MVSKRTYFFLLTLMFISIGALKADINRYVVYFKDKANNQFSIENPEEFLSSRSLQRREKNEVVNNMLDVPVTKTYITGVKELGVSVFFTSKWFNAALVQCEDSMVASIEALSYVRSVELVAVGQKLTTTISEIPEVTNSIEPESIKENTDDQLKMLGADKLHKDGYTGEGVFVAVFDAGFPGVNTSIAFKHIFDNNRLIDTWDFVTYDKNVYKSNAHGTQVFSCMGAKLQNKVVGTAYNADFAFFITEDVDDETRIEEFNWLLAAERCDSLGVEVINSSVGYYDFDIDTMNYQYADLDGNKSMITRAADIAASKGILVVTSAGNEGTGAWKHITVPADGDSVLAVGAVNQDRQYLNFSSIGPTADNRIKPDVVAMGGNATVITSNGNVVLKSGTSFASPIMAGFCASLMEAKPDLTAMEIMSTVKASASNAINPNNKIGYGVPSYGIITASSIISFEDDIDVYPNPFHGDLIYIRFKKNKPKGPFELRVIDLNGSVISEMKVNEYKKKDIIEFPVKATQPGLYFLLLNAQGINKKVKLIKF